MERSSLIGREILPLPRQRRYILLQWSKLLSSGAGRPEGTIPPAQKSSSRMFRRTFAVALIALAPVAAQAKPRLEQVYPALAAANATERAILFTGDDRQAIDTFFRRHGSHGADSKELPRRDPLLVRDRLPEKAAVRPLPASLDSHLPPLPRGYDRVIVGRDVVLLDRRSHTILDIMREVVR
jgi:hypothetical protein